MYYICIICIIWWNREHEIGMSFFLQMIINILLVQCITLLTHTSWYMPKNMSYESMAFKWKKRAQNIGKNRKNSFDNDHIQDQGTSWNCGDCENLAAGCIWWIVHQQWASSFPLSISAFSCAFREFTCNCLTLSPPLTVVSSTVVDSSAGPRCPSDSSSSAL